MLSRTVPPFGSSNILDPARLGHHLRSDEGTGIMYTTKAGFLDFGHLRDLVDLTKYVYDTLVAACTPAIARRATGLSGACTIRASRKISTTHGYAMISRALRADEITNVARAIAYEDSFAYEIATYDYRVAGLRPPGAHNSSFSPEDLPSNYIGTWVAGEALRRTYTARGGSFNDEVDNVLRWMMGEVGAQPRATTDAELRAVTGTWISGSTTSTTYLRRRNFDWKTVWVRAAPTSGAFVMDDVEPPIPQIHPFSYTFDYLGVRFSNSSFAARLMAIRSDAASNPAYGASFDSPAPAGVVHRIG